MYFYFYDRVFSAFYNKLCSWATVSYLLIYGLFLIFLAETPNLNDEMVSPILLICGEQVTMRVVFELPPSDY
jgi:hypothetical protein